MQRTSIQYYTYYYNYSPVRHPLASNNNTTGLSSVCLLIHYYNRTRLLILDREKALVSSIHPKDLFSQSTPQEITQVRGTFVAACHSLL